MPREIDRLYINKGDRELYDKLENEWILKNKTKREQFLLALTFGFKNGIKRPLSQREEFFHRKDLRLEDEALLDAIAVNSEGNIDVLTDKEHVLEIAQEYAHAGIRLLADEITTSSFGSFDKKFERDLFEYLKAISNK